MSKRAKQDTPKSETPAPYDPLPFQLARDDIRDLITMPLQAWTLIPPARRKHAAYTALMSVPLDMAAAGYAVTVEHMDAGWYLELQRDIQPGHTLRVAGRARSYVATLYQLAHTAPDVIDDVERRAKRAGDESEAA